METKLVKGHNYNWLLHTDSHSPYYTDVAPSEKMGGVPFNKKLIEKLRKDASNKRGYATYYPTEGTLTVSDANLVYSDHGSVSFECNSFQEAEELLSKIIRVETH